MSEGHLLEMFSSFQGEGPLAGVRQIFIRLGGCHLRCAYCDTPESWSRTASWRLERPPESGRFETQANPVPVERLLDIVREWTGVGRYHSVSFTGGEPLLQPGFLRAAAEGVRALGLRTYLDTSGTLAERLDEVADAIDIFALDIKLPSCEGVRMDWEDTRRCLERVRGREAFVKIVVLEDSDPVEVARAARLVRTVDGRIPLVLQPVTEAAPAAVAPGGGTLARFREACREEGVEPLVIPQIHKITGWR